MFTCYHCVVQEATTVLVVICDGFRGFLAKSAVVKNDTRRQGQSTHFRTSVPKALDHSVRNSSLVVLLGENPIEPVVQL